MTVRVGLGYDVHPFTDDETRPLVLGGVTIDGRGLAGHSDADALCHAVADALLGPAGLPDLGALFPASDDTYRDASSLELLRDVVGRVSAAGWSVVNVDVVVNAEEPRLAPHLDAMTAAVRDALGGAHVSITPKRGEGIGAVGRREGIAVLGGRAAGIGRVVRYLSTTLDPPWSASATRSCATPSSSRRASRARCRCTCAVRPSTTRRTSATPAPRSRSTPSGATSNGPGSTSRS